MPDWNPRANALFLAALERPAGRQRDALLDDQCGGDAALRAAVETLLRAHDGAGEFLEQPHPTADLHRGPPTPPSRAYAPGAVVAGRYALVRPVGEGGMGAVWAADQLAPVRRRVAVKLIRPDRDRSGHLLARFDAERQAIALMDHPHIAKLFDAGADDTGPPFFVMEFVDGPPLTEYCDAHRLTVADRLRLFIRVCRAVQHAHQKGVIHRDLKPSNILVEERDGRPVPKVIDFGLAKAVAGSRLTDLGLTTGFGQPLGTPLYMAPEQAGPEPIDVDTRADVYALGAVLYELLAGTPPIGRGDAEAAGPAGVVGLVREYDPPTPSRRVSAADTPAEVATARGGDPARLGRQLRGELDWVVMKALDKDRDRRYPSAGSLAADIGRHLGHEPVEAGPPSAAYRLRKFVRRNRPQVVAAGLLLSALVAGAAGTTYGMIEARRQARQARAAEDEALAALRSATDDAAVQLIGAKPDLGPREEAYIRKSLERWRAFASRAGGGERGRAVRAEGHFQVGRLWQRLGRHADARRELAAARDIFGGLAAGSPKNTEYRRHLAASHTRLGRSLRELGEAPAARRQLALGRDLYRALPDVSARLSLAAAVLDLGNICIDRRDPAAAVTEFTAARDALSAITVSGPAARKRDHLLAKVRRNLGVALDQQGHFKGAIAELKAALSGLKTLLRDDPSDTDFVYDLANAHTHLGNVYKHRADRGGESAAGDWRAANAEYGAGAGHMRVLSRQYPNLPTYRAALANLHNNLANVLLYGLKDAKKARERYAASVVLLEALAEQFPDREYRLDLASSRLNAGLLDRVTRDPAAGLLWYRDGLADLDGLSGPRADRLRWRLYSERVRAYFHLGRFADAAADCDPMVAAAPPDWVPEARAKRADVWLKVGRVADAAAEADALTRDGPTGWNGVQLYNFGCIFAVAARENPEYAGRAMAMLRAAVGAGLKLQNLGAGPFANDKELAPGQVAEQLAGDDDLAALRGRADFRRLVTELRAESRKQ